MAQRSGTYLTPYIVFLSGSQGKVVGSLRVAMSKFLRRNFYPNITAPFLLFFNDAVQYIPLFLKSQALNLLRFEGLDVNLSTASGGSMMQF